MPQDKKVKPSPDRLGEWPNSANAGRRRTPTYDCDRCGAMSSAPLTPTNHKCRK